MAKVLISGSSGFIGSALRKRLKAEGIEYVRIVRSEVGAQPSGEELQEIEWPTGLSELSLNGIDAVVHLAHSGVNLSDSRDEVLKRYLEPVKRLSEACARSANNTQLVFVSSQSAKSGTDSLYGAAKWECEEFLRKSTVRWSIIRPGLVYGEGSSGLFSKISKIVRASPIVPILGNGKQLIQPISIDSVVEAIVRVIRDPKTHAGQTYSVAGKPVPFKDFLQRSSNSKRVFIPIPLTLMHGMLWLIEKIVPNPPVTTGNLKGLLDLDLMETSESERMLGFTFA